MPDNLYCDQTTPWQGVYFFTNTVKVGAECCIIILVVGMIIDYVFMKHCLYFEKKAVKIGAPKFWPSYHYSSVVQTASN